MSEKPDSDALPAVITPEELDGVRFYLRERDNCATQLGAAWFEFEQLKSALVRRVEKLATEERAVVNELARRHGLEGNAFRVNLETGEIIKVR